MAEIKDNNEKTTKPRFTLNDYIHLVLSNWYWLL